jgi:hypothetical protein
MSIVEASGCERAAADVGEGGGLGGTAVGLVGGAALEETSGAERASLINARVLAIVHGKGGCSERYKEGGQRGCM